jgi:hypothetical protein
MSVQKIVVRGTGKMSLHERFTQLRFDQKATSASLKKSSNLDSVSYAAPSYSAPSYSAPSYSAPSYSPPRARLVPHYNAPMRSAPKSRYEELSPIAPVRRAAAASYVVPASSRMSRPGGVGRSQTSSAFSVGRMPSQSASIVAAAKVYKITMMLKYADPNPVGFGPC